LVNLGEWLIGGVCSNVAKPLVDVYTGVVMLNTLWLFNIAMENCPFIDGLPIKNGDCPWLC
jgi:hypothetical protein